MKHVPAIKLRFPLQRKALKWAFLFLWVFLLLKSELDAQILFQETFESAGLSDVTINQDPDTEAQFIDYSSFTVGGTTFGIDEAPNSPGGAVKNRGLLMRANTIAPAEGAIVNVLAGDTPINFAGDYIVKYDVYLSTGFSTSGGTEQTIWGLGINNDTILEGRNNRFEAVVGTWGWLCGDNGYGTEDAAIFEEGTELADLGDTQTDESAPFENAFVDMSGGQTIFPSPFGQWVAVRIQAIEGVVKVFYNDVLFFSEESSSTNGMAMIGYEDPFGSVASPTDSVWAVVDNFVVEAGCETDTRVWTGAVNSDWHLASNWSPACVPTINDEVIISVGVTPRPIIYSPFQGLARLLSVMSLGELTVESGAELLVDP